MSIKKQIHFSSNMGRMGNQMFQYACAKELSHHYGCFTSLSHLDQLVYFKLARFERFTNKIKSTLFFRVWAKCWGVKNINTGLACLMRSYWDDLVNIESPTTVWGFFQSPLYFKKSSAEIKKYFKIKTKYQSGLSHFFRQHNLQPGSYIAVHLRRTDYKGFTVPGLDGDDFTLPVSYYQNAFKTIGDTHGIPIVFVSDAPESVAELFPDIEHKIISENDAITDFLILQNAGKIILSNSTYAWWSAYLNENAGNDIYCPKYFLGFKQQIEVPTRIYPEGWNQVDVF